MTSKTLTINFSLLDEANEIEIDDLIEEINQAFSSDEIIIPWVKKIKKIFVIKQSWIFKHLYYKKLGEYVSAFLFKAKFSLALFFSPYSTLLARNYLV